MRLKFSLKSYTPQGAPLQALTPVTLTIEADLEECIMVPPEGVYSAEQLEDRAALRRLVARAFGQPATGQEPTGENDA